MHEGGRFETWARQWRIGWLGPNGQAYIGALATLLADRMHDGAVYALRQGLPKYAEMKNVRRMLVWRGVEPGPSMTDPELRDLAANAALLNRYRGTPLGLLYQLQLAGFPDAVIVQQNGRGFYLSGTPSLDDLRAARDAKESPSAFAVVDMHPSVPTDPPAGHRWVYLDLDFALCSRFVVLFPHPTTVDLTVAENLNRIRRVIVNWKPAKTTADIVVVTAGDVWDWPIDEWDSPSDNWDDPAVPAVLTYSDGTFRHAGEPPYEGPP